jgi:hypothetical protein
LASRRRRRKSIGKVIVDVERRVRRVEKRPGAKRLKTNVVTTEKLGFRAVSTKTIKVDAVETENIATDAVTANEAEFGVTVVSATDPAIVKEGTTVVDPTTGAQKVYSENLEDYIPVTDPAAQATADSKNASYYQNDAPAGTAHEIGDLWIDTNDNDKLYSWDGDSWELAQDSAAATSAATAAYNAAIASLQPSASTIVNASNQITAVNTNGITVYSGGSATTGARIVMNSAGIAGFDATSTGSGNGATFSISASTGDAVFKGSIQSGSTISGAIITGGTIRTAASGTRIEMTSGASNILYFYGSTSQPGALRVDSDNINLWAPGSTFGSGAEITMYSDTYVISPSGVFIRGGNSKALTFSMTSTTISLNQGTYGLNISSTGTKAVGASAEASEVIRNIRITQTAPTSGGDSSAYTNGTVVLVREA